jgi:ATP-binding cassette subfamily B multidrug efflux pump
MVFATEYLTAIVAQRVLRSVRVQLFAHLQRLPMSYYDRTPLGDTISRCTADVEAVSTLFSTVSAGGGGGGGTSGSTVLMGVVRLITIGVAMVVLSPLLSLVAALTVVPVVVVARFFQIRVRAAERANRRAIGMQNTHLQEALGGVEVIRSFASEAAFISRFRVALRDGLVAFNRATIYSAIYTPLMIILAGLAMALVLWLGIATPGPLSSLDISIRTFTAFILLFQRFFVPISSLGNEWQTVQAALSGLERIFQVLGASCRGNSAGESAFSGRPKGSSHRDARGVIRLSDRQADTARRFPGDSAGRDAGTGGADRGWKEQFSTPDRRSLHP